MTGKTHRVGGILGCLIGYSILQDKGLLMGDVNPLLQLAVMYPFAMYGGVAPDMDQPFASAPCHDLFNEFVCRALHLSHSIKKRLNNGGKISKWFGKKLKGPLNLFDAMHRSWQTHSDATLLLVLGITYFLLNKLDVGANGYLLYPTLLGFGMGYVSHIFLDSLTTDGIPSFILTILSIPFQLLFSKNPKGIQMKRLHLVPETAFFKTEGSWEYVVRSILKFLCILVVVRIIYMFSPYRIVFNL